MTSVALGVLLAGVVATCAISHTLGNSWRNNIPVLLASCSGPSRLFNLTEDVIEAIYEMKHGDMSAGCRNWLWVAIGHTRLFSLFYTFSYLDTRWLNSSCGNFSRLSQTWSSNSNYRAMKPQLVTWKHGFDGFAQPSFLIHAFVLHRILLGWWYCIGCSFFPFTCYAC